MSVAYVNDTAGTNSPMTRNYPPLSWHHPTLGWMVKHLVLKLVARFISPIHANLLNYSAVFI